MLAPGFKFTTKQLQAANTLQRQLNLPKADEHFLLESIAFGQQKVVPGLVSHRQFYFTPALTGSRVTM